MVVAKYTRSTGATCGGESYLVAIMLMLALIPFVGVHVVIALIAVQFAFQMMVIDKADYNIIWYGCVSQKLGPSVMRNASIGFAECVRPGGKPTMDHCLNLYHFGPVTTSIIFGIPALILLAVGPTLAFVRLWYPEHWGGVPKSRLRLWWFFIRHPCAIQGEGPSNGDGLAAMNASESINYPITPKTLECGPKDHDYWIGSKPNLRDMFHDKLFCHRFFESHGAKHPKLVCEVFQHKRREIFLEPDQAPKKLCWKGRYSTMGLGVEHFGENGWENMDDGKTWAPSEVPFVLEEMLQSTEYEASEWYRMTTLYPFDEDEPKPGYTWRTRNDKGDPRVQTDILGGAYCITSKYTPYVGPTDKSMVVDPRTGKKTPIDAKVEIALTKAIDLQKKMHKNLGKELHSIGWDVMIVGDEPYFIEFNINNGFFVADHSMDELEVMAAYYSREFFARLPSQLINFDPYAEESSETSDSNSTKKKK